MSIDLLGSTHVSVTCGIDVVPYFKGRPERLSYLSDWYRRMEMLDDFDLVYFHTVNLRRQCLLYMPLAAIPPAHNMVTSELAWAITTERGVSVVIGVTYLFPRDQCERLKAMSSQQPFGCRNLIRYFKQTNRSYMMKDLLETQLPHLVTNWSESSQPCSVVRTVLADRDISYLTTADFDEITRG